MREPQCIPEGELTHTLAQFLRDAQGASRRVVGVLDVIPAPLTEVVSFMPSCGPISLFLTSRVAVPDALAACCEHVHLPNLSLPGKIGGFFLSGQQAIFRLREGPWYAIEGDDEIMRHLVAIGDQVLRLTRLAEDL